MVNVGHGIALADSLVTSPTSPPTAALCFWEVSLRALLCLGLNPDFRGLVVSVAKGATPRNLGFLKQNGQPLEQEACSEAQPGADNLPTYERCLLGVRERRGRSCF